MDRRMRILVTGAEGFVGRILCPVLEGQGYDVVRAVRVAGSAPERHEETTVAREIHGDTDWSGVLLGVDVIVHLAAKAHMMKIGPASRLANFREVNVAGTARLVTAAATAGVRRIVYLSTIKVNGESTGRTPFTSSQLPNPVDPYGVSKAEAEAVLRKLEKALGIEVVIIRPPLIYGRGVKGNLRSLLTAIEGGIPLPFGAVRNRRDLISVYNLCDLITVCIEHGDAGGRTFLVADNEPLSTAELVRHIASAQSKNPRLLDVPEWLIRAAARLLGKTAQVDRLLGNLELDTRYTRDVLGWVPPMSVSESFCRMFRDG
jgi:nucleoside-diphosphate-sugar epimerase